MTLLANNPLTAMRIMAVSTLAGSLSFGCETFKIGTGEPGAGGSSGVGGSSGMGGMAGPGGMGQGGGGTGGSKATCASAITKILGPTEPPADRAFLPGRVTSIPDGRTVTVIDHCWTTDPMSSIEGNQCPHPASSDGPDPAYNVVLDSQDNGFFYFLLGPRGDAEDSSSSGGSGGQGGGGMGGSGGSGGQGGGGMGGAGGGSETNPHGDPLLAGATYLAKARAKCDDGSMTAWSDIHSFVPGPASAAWLRLDQTSGTDALDFTGNGNNGTTVGSPVWTTVGNVKGLSLNGTDQFINLNSAVANLGFNSSDDYTLIMRFRSDAGAMTSPVLFGMYAAAGAAPGFDLNIEPVGGLSKLRLKIQNATPDPDDLILLVSTDSVTTNQSHHIIGSYDGGALLSSLTLFMNGIEQGTGSDGFSFTASQFAYSAIGAVNYGAPSDLFPGFVDEWRVIKGRSLVGKAAKQAYCADEVAAGAPLPNDCKTP